MEFPNRRRKLLRGMLHVPAKATPRRPTPAVVFFHGFTGDRMESHWLFIKCSRALEREGIASLRFDFFGSGESEGEFREATLLSEINDARDAVRWVRQQKRVDPDRIGLCGLSLGGAVASCVASAVKARALVLWSAVAHPSILEELAGTLSKPIPDCEDAVEYDARAVSTRFVSDAAKADPLKEIHRYTQPTLIIHPEKDASVPPSHADDFLNASAASIKERIIIAGADHTFTSIAWETEVIRRTVELFRAYL